ncbi:MAG: hypothetical protein Q8Q03_01330, partial [bacterium]|nr:hypothetical protein [bacterium]
MKKTATLRKRPLFFAVVFLCFFSIEIYVIVPITMAFVLKNIFGDPNKKALKAYEPLVEKVGA